MGQMRKTPFKRTHLQNCLTKGLTLCNKSLGCAYIIEELLIDDTILTALSSIASKQTTVTEDTMMKVIHSLDYLATHPDTVIMFRALDMILHVHSGASDYSKKKAKSRMGGYFFLGYVPRKKEDIFSMRLNPF